MAMTVQDIEQKWGLKSHFVYKCLKEIALLQPHIQVRDKNKRVLDDDGVRIFENIATYKAEQMTFPEIQKMLDGENHSKPPSKPPLETKSFERETEPELIQKQVELAWFHQYTEQLQAMQNRLDEQQQRASQELHDREKLIRDLLIEKAGLQADLKALPSKEDYENSLKQQHDKQEHEQQRKQEAAKILGELKASTGILKGKRRKELLRQLEELLS